MSMNIGITHSLRCDPRAIIDVVPVDLVVIFKIYKKMKNYCELVEYATIKQWDFKDSNTQILWNSLEIEDKNVFNFNVKDINWENFYYNFVSGVRQNVLKDDMSSIEKAKTKAKLYGSTRINHVWMVMKVVYRKLESNKEICSATSSGRQYTRAY
ncbi:hypothetical protein RI129_012885 [Pyrocoelia pectoralis]|uniref:Fatty acyl-CoA reductase C-terminal domain-containing protein n=1 Tax=Pyrocoelia pectoralis TaxID=417401 RepID=A0AAN7UUP9_9COLE